MASWFPLIMDTVPPVTSNVRVTNINKYFCNISVVTDEPSSIRILLGTSMDVADKVVQTNQYLTYQVIPISNIQPSTVYYFQVVALDDVDNSYSDNIIYTFTTPDSESMTNLMSEYSVTFPVTTNLSQELEVTAVGHGSLQVTTKTEQSMIVTSKVSVQKMVTTKIHGSSSVTPKVGRIFTLRRRS